MEHSANPDFSLIDPEDWGIRLVEEERRRIARDLHDGPIQVLINLSMRLQIIQRMLLTDSELAKDELDRSQQRLIGSINEIRQLIYDLQPVAIDEIGLYAAIEALATRAQKDWGLVSTVVLPDVADIGLTPAKTIAVYRLIQEAINNIHKHSHAEHAAISIALDPSQLIITIADDGIGFDPSETTEGHFGLSGMTDRIQYLGGSAHIESAPGSGSTLTFTVPRGPYGSQV
ncbi:MAG: sensor histidine kinase [Sulfobacillus benefaciens]|uniref:histidine kinase n=1 Tax=Sulfobacillus benefaciens TaxID=453960 RepID=A0A2T2XKN5_9FIRM|nr:MAG: sensor histidine kinase [Sulfobacillus benefaciens]